MTALKSHPFHPWDRSTHLNLQRTNRTFDKPGNIDPGINFFVLALELLGAEPQWSCEGHPTGTYVAFYSTYELAQEIHAAGFFQVEIEGEGYWSIRMNRFGQISTEGEKIRNLRWATEAWLKRFQWCLDDLHKLLPSTVPERFRKVLSANPSVKSRNTLPSY